MLQFCMSVMFPSQSFPWGAKASKVQFRTRLWVPVPHVRVQGDQLLHIPNAPSTEIEFPFDVENWVRI